ncbi:MAG: hypothetical protein KJP25_10930, partial [Gammaproteobacteria bacterium]|nr:hypothetical protein [Gammaproteobacteria bacterium]
MAWAGHILDSRGSTLYHYTYFAGSQALSAFRNQRLLDAVNAALQSAPASASVGARLTALNAKYLHVVCSHRALQPHAEEQLRQLLQYGEVAPSRQPMPGATQIELFVAPRVGTISPWSSKASDIAHNCDLASVVRIERAVAYQFECENLTGDNGNHKDKATLVQHCGKA